MPSKLGEVLATTDELLYRRGNFNGSFDQLICNALRDELDAEIAFSPGFRWGTTLLPGVKYHSWKISWRRWPLPTLRSRSMK